MKNKGNYYKLRTKKWLEAKGYEVAFLERMMWIPDKREPGKLIPIKRDQMGADLLAMSKEHVVFVQVKLNRNNIGAARIEFAKHTFPESKEIEKWIVVWEPRDREPEVIEV